MIQQTKAYLKMDAVQQRIINMASNRKKITYHLQLLQNVGMDRWQELNHALPTRWKNIVMELNQKGEKK